MYTPSGGIQGVGTVNADHNKDFVIGTHGLSKSFGETVALKDLNLRVPRNSIFGFLGPNGAGKTTTIKLLLGLIRPTAGGGTVFGSDISRNSVEVRRRIGYLAQVPSYYTHMTAREILRFKMRFYYSGPRQAIEERVEETLGMVELEDKADRPIKGFSGGERQRLGIAQAQVHRPDLLILDEPAANLDPMGRRDVLSIMEGLRERSTIFYSTHILDDVQRVSDTVAILNRGELLAQAPIEELLAGGGGIVYTMTVKGDHSAAYSRISAQEWVTGVTVVHGDDRTRLQIGVSDEGAAEDLLLRLAVAEGGAVVTEFGRRRYELEDVFVDMVEGDNGGG
ncbi:ABC transporter ATP-binding protein [Candidatus Bathyarchaeota archaeon]|nr:ABC transporter ATP-binding protein [Candidatus Bathyarchaeota archaeon]